MVSHGKVSRRILGSGLVLLASLGLVRPAMPQDMLTATVQAPSQAGFTTQPLNLSSSRPVRSTFVPRSTSGIGVAPLAVHNWHLTDQLPHFIAALAGGTARVVALGDSITRGFGSAESGWTQTSYPVELAQALASAGIPAQSDGFLGDGGFYSFGTDNRVTLVGGAQWNGGVVDAGGPALSTAAAGDGFDFTLNWPGSYDRVTLSYVDAGGGRAGVSVDGAPVATLAFGNTGNTVAVTLNVPAGAHTTLSVRQTGAAPTYIQGAAFWSSTRRQIQVLNAGIGGWTSGAANTSVCQGGYATGSACGFGQTAGVAALSPSLVIVNLGVNDMLQGVPTATIVANIDAIVTTLQTAGSDVMLMVPQPTGAPEYIAGIDALRVALKALAERRNLPLVDLWKTYRSFDALSAAGLMGSDTIHPDSTLYADIADGLVRKLRTGLASPSP